MANTKSRGPIAGFAVFMASESLSRFVNPVSIRFNEAIAVAILGLSLTAIFSSEVGASNVAARARRQRKALELVANAH